MNLVNKDLPSTWVQYQTGLCQGCLAQCCSLPVEVNREELVRLGLVKADEVEGSLKKVAKRLLGLGWVQKFSAETGRFILGQNRAGVCVFLGDDRKCSVYENRPDVCRDFPNIGPRPGYCPSQKSGL